VQPLADADSRGGSWNQDGVIIFVKNAEGPIFRVASSGGEEAIPVTKLDPPRQSSHRYPQFLPDGRHFLYYAYGTAPGTYVGQLDGSEPKKLDMAGMAAVYAASGHLLFMHQETLFAQKFDPVKLELTGDAFVIVEGGLAYDPATLVALSTSAAGPIAYRPRSGRRQFIWFDRSGTETGRVGEPEDGRTGNPSPTPFWDRIAPSVMRAASGYLKLNGAYSAACQKGRPVCFLSCLPMAAASSSLRIETAYWIFTGNPLTRPGTMNRC
jgi:hypothetical protein